jgi:hypothetical protein
VAAVAEFYALAKNMEDDLIITPVPALVAVLLAKEKEKGLPLTKEEVEEIADRAECIAMPNHARKKVDEARGYDDIDPEKAWDEWQNVRKDLL